MRTRTATVLTVVASLAVVGTAYGYGTRGERAERAIELCQQVAGPDGWRFVEGACYDENPWTGTFTRVELP